MADRNDLPIKRALISVYDKTAVVDFARVLADEFNIEIISTGGTARLFKENNIPVTLVEEITGFPEMLDGRVKTLHPMIFGGILADRDNPEHMRQLKEQGIRPIDMVVVNLYPFGKTIAHADCTFEQAIEMIDIGGPSLLRAAAKNHKHVLVASDPGCYPSVLDQLRRWDERPGEANSASISEEALRAGAFGAFWGTTRYDAEIATWLSGDGSKRDPEVRAEHLWNLGSLRYGENPHQDARIFSIDGSNPVIDLTTAGANSGDESRLSFNNYVDADAALGLCAEISRELTSATISPDQCGTGFQPVSEGPDQCGTGFQPVSEGPDQCGTGFQPVSKNPPAFRKVDDERHFRRNLPHIQTPGKTYFLTTRIKSPNQLSSAERDIVLAACMHWQQTKMLLHAAVVMPDHLHLLVTPMEDAQHKWISLGEIMHSIKRYSAREINKLRDSQGPIWQDEYFDRIMRNDQEYQETLDYIANNPLTAGLADSSPYPWHWEEGSEEEPNITERIHRLKTGATPLESAAASDETTARVEERELTSATISPDQCGTGSEPVAKAGKVCVFIKHTNACGVGINSDEIESYRRAYLGDPNAAMGGILACNFRVGRDFAQSVMETYARWGKEAGAGGFFAEVWVAPGFDEDAVESIRSLKKWGERVRLLDVENISAPEGAGEPDYKKIAGGMLIQDHDNLGLAEDQWKVVTQLQPSEAQLQDLRLAWLVCKHTKSNAITVCRDGMLLGNGAGQMSRVMSCRIATWLARENGHEKKLEGSVAASDAFFPFADGPNLLIDGGITAIIQPGGSKRDQETIDVCNQRGVAMIFTSARHFRH